ncbi:MULTISPECIES: transglycosylase domain-containing protein [unclassified Novosphingobium]|uniref:penicillin-binding protein 1A n=1 Tax=unclassified Novosphingobium TaxID=2644732 RepID=UPI0006C8BB47|nr:MULTISPECIES: transglycosylase domain-containing protein [unclassified Novosphingobium]KPH61663.1 penicillin-binding protein [Novosphingobium sp. ST904]MPS69553.1 penicillin-binding protein [Novosphingobium sp.]TCM40743.1 penicillin-binding protein 1A [Novosphingobium sp. ST904]
MTDEIIENGSEQPPEDAHYRIRRGAGGRFAGRFSGLGRAWRERKGLRRLSYVAGAGLVVLGGLWVGFTHDLPDANKLLEYQPPLPTMVRGIDGEIVYSYARERRVQLRYVDFPRPLVDAFLSAEDKTFWTHGGVDVTGLAGAVVDYASKLGTGGRARGGSTITQQVAKNILIGDEYSVTRKLKEMVVARRIEGVLTKQQILELYLNEIPLGRQSFGVQAAARAYFGKDVDQLQLHEVAFLAILPKAPERYGRKQYEGMAIERRNWVLGQMVENGWASRADAEAAKSQPLGLIPRRAETYPTGNGYFIEEVRRRLIDQYGEKAEDGPNSVYAGGLWVRTSLDTQMQDAVRDGLRAGLLRYQGNRAWAHPIAHINDLDSWQTQLIVSNKTIDYKDWRIGVILDRSGSTGRIGFSDGNIAALTNVPDLAKTGDLVAAAPVSSGTYAVRTIPEVSGGMVIEQPATGRVMAMQGGFDSGLDAFNRAIQAERQPGSTIKPFVYATGLQYGMTPATQVLDGTFCVYQGAGLGDKCFRNFGGAGGSGSHTMRWGLEQSRNLMTVRIANDTGMSRVVKTFKTVGIGEYKPYLSFALGAGETTVSRMVNAYSALANNGVQFGSSVVDYVQDRNGKVIWKADNRRCDTCNMAEWDGKPMPRIDRKGKQVIDAGTAYQVVHMLEGVVTRGTAVTLRDLNMPMFGKTGTTNGPTDVWFVGGTQDYVGGVYLGYDSPRSLGGYAQGGRIAAPIFKQVVQATRARWGVQPFVAPAGIRMVRIDRVTGKQVMGVEPGNDPKAAVIWEAFKPDTEPRQYTPEDEFARRRDALVSEIRGAQEARQASAAAAAGEAQDFAEQQGGVY